MGTTLQSLAASRVRPPVGLASARVRAVALVLARAAALVLARAAVLVPARAAVLVPARAAAVVTGMVAVTGTGAVTGTAAVTGRVSKLPRGAGLDHTLTAHEAGLVTRGSTRLTAATSTTQDALRLEIRPRNTCHIRRA
jgi:hypothetical protein